MAARKVDAVTARRFVEQTNLRVILLEEALDKGTSLKSLRPFVAKLVAGADRANLMALATGVDGPNWPRLATALSRFTAVNI